MLNDQPLFLGWNAGFLARAVSWILKSCASESVTNYCDLSKVAIALPGRRAGRKLLELLVTECKKRELLLIPPSIVSIGEIPELLYHTEEVLTSPSEELLIMSSVLSTLSPEIVEELTTKADLSADYLRSLAVAKQLLALRAELGKAGVGSKEVIEAASVSPEWEEEERWEALQKIYDLYEAALISKHRVDRELARRAALEQGTFHSHYTKLILIGCSELSLIIKKFLKQSECEITALIQAPDECAPGFHVDGSIAPHYWNKRVLTIPDESIFIAESATTLAQYAIDIISALKPAPTIDTLTVGVADERLRTLLTERFKEYGVTLRNSEGVPLADANPVTLLRAFLRIDNRHHYGVIATFVRHPDAQEYFSECYAKHCGTSESANEQTKEHQIDFAAALDRYYFEHLPAALSETSPVLSPPLILLMQELSVLRALLPNGKVSAKEAANSFMRFYAKIYTERKLSTELLAAATQCKIVIEELASLAELHSGGKEDLRTLTAWSQLLLQRMSSEKIPASAALDTLEELGWLELPLDDAPYLIVCGMHEGIVPEAITADPYLPHTIRERLGLLSNEERFARDRYNAEALQNSRSKVWFLAAKESVNREPLMLSRVLLSGEREQVIARVAHYYEAGSQKESCTESVGKLAQTTPAIVLPVPVEPSLSPLHTLSISSFKDYLSCPYLFYLKHVKRLRVIDDRARELSALHFGQLLHEVLAKFSVGDYRSATNVAVIEKELLALLEQCVAKQFGEKAQPAVKIQIEQLRRRIQGFAYLQSSIVHAGWEILHTEYALGGVGGVSIEVDGEPVILKGRIDRIDRHRESGALRIIDYKTGEGSPDPHRALKKQALKKQKGDAVGSTWRDLQLPLYYGLFKVTNPELAEHPLTTAYIGLSPKSEAVKLTEAAWGDAEYESGWLCMEECVKKIRAAEFSLSPEYHPTDEYAFIYGVA